MRISRAVNRWATNRSGQRGCGQPPIRLQILWWWFPALKITPEEARGIKVTSLGQRRYSDSITKALDPKGKEYFWIGGEISAWTGADDADYRAVKEGCISVTPLHLDLTNYRLLEEIRGWNLAL